MCSVHIAWKTLRLVPPNMRQPRLTIYTSGPEFRIPSSHCLSHFRHSLDSFSCLVNTTVKLKSASSMAENFELIFLGTGTSSSLPQIQCVTAGPDDPVCQACLSSLTPEGRKNARRNTSAAIRIKDSGGQSKCVCSLPIVLA